jgi:betaine-aldehyde dehydrogenase
MELGDKSPLILFEDANIENAVGGAILANFHASGQVCSNGTRVFVHKAIKHAFLERLVERLRQAVIGDPMDETTNFGPLVSQRQMEIVQSFIAKGRDLGARLVYGGGAGGARWLLY